MGEIGTDENFGDKTGGDRPRKHCIFIDVCTFIDFLRMGAYIYIRDRVEINWMFVFI
jgi:hypothetical protein